MFKLQAEHRRENDMSLHFQISTFNRKRKWDLFLKEFTPGPGLRVLDVGFADIEENISDNFIEKNYPYPERLTALGTALPVEFRARYPKIAAVHYDGSIFPFQDGAFDVIWSNAVLEHVGDRRRQASFLKEIKRVAKRAFVTTPNRYFPIEIHTLTPFLHYLPKKMFDEYLTLVGKEWAAGEYMHLLKYSEIKALLSDAGITKYRIVRNRLGVFTLDFVILF
jgi:SAM-dependent methyltransferase